jgi:hypothetical protein
MKQTPENFRMAPPCPLKSRELQAKTKDKNKENGKDIDDKINKGHPGTVTDTMTCQGATVVCTVMIAILKTALILIFCAADVKLLRAASTKGIKGLTWRYNMGT